MQLTRIGCQASPIHSSHLRKGQAPNPSSLTVSIKTSPVDNHSMLAGRMSAIDSVGTGASPNVVMILAVTMSMSAGTAVQVTKASIAHNIGPRGSGRTPQHLPLQGHLSRGS